LNRAQNKVFDAILVEVTKTIGSKKYKLKRNTLEINSIFFFNSGVNSLSLITIAEVPVLRFNLYFLEPDEIDARLHGKDYYNAEKSKALELKIDNLVQVGARDKNYKFANARVDVLIPYH
jgi:hypothetical protein